MGKITVTECIRDGVIIEGLKIIEPTVFGDTRGYFILLSQLNIAHILFSSKVLPIPKVVPDQ